MSYENDNDVSSGPPCTEYRLLTDAEMVTLPDEEWRVDDLLPTRGLALIYGPSMSGKSYLALDLAIAIADGREWFGLRTEIAPVVYFSLEGSGLIKRQLAWVKRNEVGLPKNFKSVETAPFGLNEKPDVDGLVKLVLGVAESGAVTIIDTLARASSGLDENSSQDMGEAVKAADEIALRTGGLVILVHHTGKTPGAGPRGSSSLLAAADAAIAVERKTDSRIWVAEKVKDGEDGLKRHFKLGGVVVGRDKRGKDITACVVQGCEGANEASARELTFNQACVLEALKRALMTAPTGVAYAPPEVAALTRTQAREVAKDALKPTVPDSKHRSSRANEVLKTLYKSGLIKTGGPRAREGKYSAGGEPSEIDKVVWLG